MHLEGPGPIPVDDPEAAECHLEFDRWWSLVSSDGGTTGMFKEHVILGKIFLHITWVIFLIIISSILNKTNV